MKTIKFTLISLIFIFSIITACEMESQWVELPANPLDKRALDLSGKGMTDDELVYLMSSGEIPHDIEELIISFNKISDLTSLQSLTNITVLSLSNNQINDLTPLQSLTSLKLLQLSGNYLSDLSPLMDLDTLEYLFIERNKIELPQEQVKELRKALPNCYVLITNEDIEKWLSGEYRIIRDEPSAEGEE